MNVHWDASFVMDHHYLMFPLLDLATSEVLQVNVSVIRFADRFFDSNILSSLFEIKKKSVFALFMYCFKENLWLLPLQLIKALAFNGLPVILCKSVSYLFSS